MTRSAQKCKNTSIPSRRIPWRATPTRRGSFLVFVVGVLALLAVTTVTYIAIGSSDMKTAAAAKDQVEAEQVSQDFADYISTLVGDDVFHNIEDKIELTSTSVSAFRRELTDYPSTPEDQVSPTIKSRSVGFPGPSPKNVPIFDPIGRNFDPWLADAEPVVLDPNAANGGTSEILSNADTWFLRRDWRHISNISPVGWFVNLAQLRGSFDIEPRLLTEGLVLRETDGTAQSPRNSKVPFRATNAQGNDFVVGKEVFRPAHWDTWQVGTFRPLADSPTRFGSDPAPSNDRGIRNQWADADGDGYADSRWTELITTAKDITDNNIYAPVLPKRDDLRYFIAARIIDLSSRVNVNTATDFRHLTDGRNPTDIPLPVGLTPADVDLRRLLTLADFTQVPYLDDPKTNIGNSGITETLTGTFIGYNALPQFGGIKPEDIPQSYHLMDPALTLSNPGDEAFAPGALGYQAATFFVDPGSRADNKNFANTEVIQDDERTIFYEDFASANAPIRFINTAYEVADRFGTESLIDLLAYRVANDPSTLSLLEATIGGQFNLNNDPTGIGATFADGRHSPLRENRGLDRERLKANIFGTKPEPWNPLPESLWQSFIDVRQHLTTDSGSRPLRTRVAIQPPAATTDPLGPLSAAKDLRIDIVKALDDISGSPTILTPIHQVFRGYADALLPYSAIEESWNKSATDYTRLKTLTYGYDGPETALYIAAHMTANLVDMYDNNTGLNQDPTFFTLVVDPSITPPTGSWAYTSVGNTNGRVLDLNDITGTTRLATSPGYVSTSAVNIYGIEAQPVISAAASYSIYTDAPTKSWKALSTTENSDGGNYVSGVCSGGKKVNIDSDPPSTANPNPDFLANIIVVQLYNPFEEAIELFNTEGKPNYYIEFGGNFYAVAKLNYDASLFKWDWATTKLVNLSNFPMSVGQNQIDPGEAVNLVLIQEDPTRVQKRFAKLLTILNAESKLKPTGYNANSKDKNVFFRWLNKQLTVTGATGPARKPIIAVPFNPNTMVSKIPINPDGVYADPSDPVNPTPLDANTQVLLWRIINDGTESPNRQNNDLLADRLHQKNPLAAIATLDTRLTRPGIGGIGTTLDGNVDVASTKACVDPTDSSFPAGTSMSGNDNTGYTITSFASIRRNPGPLAMPDAAVSGFLVESKDVANGLITNGLANLDSFGTFSGGSKLTKSDFTSRGGAKNFGKFLSKQVDATGGIGTGGGGGGASALIAAMTKVNERVKAGAIKAPLNSTKKFWDIDPAQRLTFEITLPENKEFSQNLFTDNRKISTLRLADLLLPLGIGPRYDNSATSTGGTRIQDLNAQWLTLTEAIALAMGYDKEPHRNGTTSPLYDLGGKGILDKGRLRLDDFVAFNDIDGDGIYTAPTDFNKPDPKKDEQRIGSGVPMAFDILSQFRTLGVGDPTNPTNPRTASGSIDTPVRGQININTAPVAVLRTIPMLSPINDNDPSNLSKPNGQWWWNTGDHDNKSDIAATLRAYRDKGREYPLPQLTTGGLGSFVSFEDSNPTGTPLPSATTPDGRLSATGITAISEQPGFSNIGEILAVRDIVFSTPAHDIDRLGNILANTATPSINHRAVDPLLYNGADDNIPDDFDERLAIANAALNSITVGSDFYACWFIIHGYSRQDVEGLEPDDPMIPSVTRRYLLILDRSNVIKPGDKPRVIAFKELPM